MWRTIRWTAVLLIGGLAAGLGGCRTATSAIQEIRPVTTAWVEVQVVTRQAGDEPVAISVSVQARTGPPVQISGPAPGVCVPEAPAQAVAQEQAFAGAMELRMPELMRLPWDGEHRAFLLAGPQVGPVPDWAVADLRWVEGTEQIEVPGAVRLGEAPRPLRVERRPDGGVRLRWEADAPVDVRTQGLVCGGARDGVDLPWWAVPAKGGEIVLRSSRTHRSLAGERLVIGRAVMERAVPLDAPPEVAPVQAPAPTLRKVDPARSPAKPVSRRPRSA